MKLTHRNYFTLKNQYITNSKIKDFLKDKRYFYEKHVLGTIEQEMTDALIIGKAIDYWIFNGEKKFKEKYYLVSRRNKSDKDYEFQLNTTMYEQVERMARKITMQTAFRQLRGYKKQVILQYDMDLGQFPGIAGIPDWLKVDEKNRIAEIVDLKTAENAQNPTKYHYKCLEYGYYLQVAMYKKLVNLFWPHIQEVICKHLVIEKDRDNINNVYTYILSKTKIQEETERLNVILEEIKNEKKFMPHDACWENAVEIGVYTEEFYENTETS